MILIKKIQMQNIYVMEKCIKTIEGWMKDAQEINIC